MHATGSGSLFACFVGCYCSVVSHISGCRELLLVTCCWCIIHTAVCPAPPLLLQRDGCPKIINLGSAKTDLFYERKK